jgi:sirohydrochlorin ferrochelatase
VKERLVTVAHGSRDSEGPRAIRALVKRVGRRLAGVEVVESYVELAEPSFASVMATAQEPSVVVPLLLSTGYHVNVDLPEAARLSPLPVTMARPLGPHPLLAAAGAMQLRAAGAGRGDAVVMVVAGSKDPDAATEALVAGRLLGAHWGAPVRVAFLSGSGPSVPEVFAELREQGRSRIATSPYLLAPGHFATKASTVARAQGTFAVADVLAHHPLVAELVVRRYLAARRSALAGGPAGAGLRRSVA